MSIVTQKRVLVLNKSWQPIRVWTVKQAVRKVFSDQARIIDPTQDFQQFTWDDWSEFMPEDHEKKIVGTRTFFRVPEVVIVSEYDKLPVQTVHFNRRNLFKRDKGTCQYCGGKKSKDMTIDHIIPRSQGGRTTWENCCLACVECNSHKADKTPKQARMKFLPKFKAKKPSYSLDFHTDVRIESWKHFLSEAYWNVTLENDIQL